MKLNETQIQKVENYLHKKRFDYVDLKHEVLDHMILDIESKMKSENVGFKSAFHKVRLEKWSRLLREDSSFMFGLGFSAPKLVIEKAKKGYLKFYLALFIAYFLPLLALTRFNFQVLGSLYLGIMQLLLGICFLLFAYIMIAKGKQPKTTYSFVLKTQSLNVILGFILVANLFTNNSGSIDNIEISMFFAFVFSTITYVIFFQKHLKTLKKYKFS